MMPAKGSAAEADFQVWKSVGLNVKIIGTPAPGIPVAEALSNTPFRIRKAVSMRYSLFLMAAPSKTPVNQG